MPEITVSNVLASTLVDGYNAELKTLFGRSKDACAMDRDTVNPVNHLTMHYLSQQTLEKVKFLKDSGCNVVEIRTCDIKGQLAVDPEMKEFFDNFEVSEPLEPRQAFFGGRTNATRLFYDAKQDEKIRYVDFCSLYPWYAYF